MSIQTDTEWDETELVVARTLSGDQQTFSFLSDTSSKAQVADAPRECAMPLGDGWRWQQSRAVGVGGLVQPQTGCTRGLSRTTPMQNSTLGAGDSLRNLCQASSSSAVDTNHRYYACG